MSPFGFEARWRDAPLDAMNPAPGDGLPPMAEVDRSAFWPRFERTAPFEVKLGRRFATCPWSRRAVPAGLPHDLHPPRRGGPR